MRPSWRKLPLANMWDSIFGLIPEKRQPGALGVLAFCSITLPILAAICGVAAWKLNDRLSRQRLPLAGPAAPAAPLPERIADPETQAALHTAESVLLETQKALHNTEAELEQAKMRARNAVAVSQQRHITQAQKDRFIKASAFRPKGQVGISAIENDPESRAYAEQVRSLLLEAGYEVGSELGAIQLRSDSLVGLRVGAFSKDTAPPHALPLAASFIDSDISAFPVINQKVPAGKVEVTVGTNPAAMEDELSPAPAAPEPPAATPIPREKVVAPVRSSG